MRFISRTGISRLVSLARHHGLQDPLLFDLQGEGSRTGSGSPPRLTHHGFQSHQPL